MKHQEGQWDTVQGLEDRVIKKNELQKVVRGFVGHGLDTYF